MFSYYGSKSKIVQYYPEPKYDHIIEPFAGSARYALKYWDREVTLVDKYDVIVRVWKYLQQASIKDIESLPEIDKGDKIDDYVQLSLEEKWLIGFCFNRGNASPCKTANNWNSWTKDKKRIANDLHKIKHWKIIHGSYQDLEREREMPHGTLIHPTKKRVTSTSTVK